MVNVSAANGVFYPLSSVADCMELCLSKSDCVAIDVWPVACSLHMNASNLVSSRVTSGVSQFVLDRFCPVSTASTTSSRTGSTTPLPTTGLWHYVQLFASVFLLVSDSGKIMFLSCLLF